MTRTTKADYAKHYAEYQGKPEQIAKRSARNKARRAMLKKHGAKALAGKDVDHKKPLRKGGGNGMSNLRLRSIKSNRGDTH